MGTVYRLMQGTVTSTCPRLFQKFWETPKKTQVMKLTLVNAHVTSLQMNSATGFSLEIFRNF